MLITLLSVVSCRMLQEDVAQKLKQVFKSKSLWLILRITQNEGLAQDWKIIPWESLAQLRFLPQLAAFCLHWWPEPFVFSSYQLYYDTFRKTEHARSREQDLRGKPLCMHTHFCVCPKSTSVLWHMHKALSSNDWETWKNGVSKRKTRMHYMCTIGHVLTMQMPCTYIVRWFLLSVKIHTNICVCTHFLCELHMWTQERNSSTLVEYWGWENIHKLFSHACMCVWDIHGRSIIF